MNWQVVPLVEVEVEVEVDDEITSLEPELAALEVELEVAAEPVVGLDVPEVPCIPVLASLVEVVLVGAGPHAASHASPSTKPLAVRVQVRRSLNLFILLLILSMILQVNSQKYTVGP